MHIFSKSATGHDLPAVMTNDGQVRLLARPAAKVPHFRMGRNADPSWLIDRSKWVEYDRTQTSVPMLNQGSVGKCTGDGFANTNMVARAQANEVFQLLCGASIYAQTNGGVDQGASLTDTVKASQSFGINRTALVPDTYYTERQLARAYPGAAADAARFVTAPDAWATFSTFAQAGSLAQMGWQLYFSVTAGNAWSDQNRYTKYWVPVFYPGSGNHAQSGGEAMTNQGGDWLIKVRQSWGTDVADQGFYNIDSRFIDQQEYFEGYALYFASQDPQDPNLGPVAA